MRAYIFILCLFDIFGLILDIIVFQFVKKYGLKKEVNPIKEFINDDSEDVAVRENSFMVRTLIYAILFFVAATVHLLTKVSLWGIVLGAIFVLHFVEIFGMLPEALDVMKAKGSFNNVPEKVMGEAIKNALFQLLMLYVLNVDNATKIYTWLERVCTNPQLVEIIVVGVIGGIIYLLTLSIIISIYTIIGFCFFSYDLTKIQHKYDCMNSKYDETEELLKQETKVMNEKAQKQNFLKNLKMGVGYLKYNIKIYISKNRFLFLHTMLFFKLKCCEFFKGFLKTEVYNRFCKRVKSVLIVAMLLIVNIYLYINFSNNEAVVHFYELLSTVIIIPIVLAKITEK